LINISDKASPIRRKKHAFGEGNTRTTAVFTIKYLRSFGFDIDNDLFEKHSWYFRNALVRANYNNLSKGIVATDEYLLRFFRNLMLGEDNTLSNRELHIASQSIKKNISKSHFDTLNDTLEGADRFFVCSLEKSHYFCRKGRQIRNLRSLVY